MSYLELARQVVKETSKVQGNQDLGKAKGVALQPIPFETLNAIFEEASEKLSLIYKGGEYEYARIHYPELYQAERDALKRVDALWFDALAGKVSLEVFRQAVHRWHESVIAFINTHIEVKNEQKIP